jgi:transcriptional regulator
MPGQNLGRTYREHARVLGVPLPCAQCVGSVIVYLPRHFAARDAAEVAAFVDSAGAADLVTFDGTKPVASLIPVIWERPGAGDGAPQDANGAQEGVPEGGYGRLLGHLALANPQWHAAGPGTIALAIVHGPQAYVSPSWYPSTARHGKMVPTWNYVSVHLTGPLTVHRDPGWLRDLVGRLTARHEDGRAAPWRLSDAPSEFIDAQLRAIVGIELTITSVEAKEKLSQNRNPEDQAGALAGLRGEPGPGPAAIASLMARLAAGQPGQP